MSEIEQVKKIKCPHCGWIRSVNTRAVEDASAASVARGLSESFKEIAGKIKTALDDTQLDAANAWIDMPKCPYCERVYRYNVRTGETLG